MSHFMKAPFHVSIACSLSLMLVCPVDARVSLSGFVDIGYWAAQNPGYGLTNAATGLPDHLQASASTLGVHDGDDQFALNDVELAVESEMTETLDACMVFNFGNGANPTIAEAFVSVEHVSFLDLGLTIGRFGSVFGVEQAFTGPVENRFITTSILAPFTTGSLDGVSVAADAGPFALVFAVSNDDLLPGATLGTNPFAAAGGGVAGRVVEVNNDRAIMGRVGWTATDNLAVGVSGSRSVWAAPVTAASAVPDAPNPLRTMLGVDVDWNGGPWHFKGEYVVADEAQLYKLGSEVPIRWTGWYVEGWHDWTETLGFGSRFAQIKARQGTNLSVPPANVSLVSDYESWSFAVRWQAEKCLNIKGEYVMNRESVLNRVSTAGHETDNDVLALSLVATF